MARYKNNKDGTRTLIAGKGEDIKWITKEQWDAMTPEQKSDPNITYGVRGLGASGGNEVVSFTCTKATFNNSRIVRNGNHVYGTLDFTTTEAIQAYTTFASGLPTPDNLYYQVNTCHGYPDPMVILGIEGGIDTRVRNLGDIYFDTNIGSGTRIIATINYICK